MSFIKQQPNIPIKQQPNFNNPNNLNNLNNLNNYSSIQNLNKQNQYLDIYSAIEYLNMCVNNNFCLINQINQKLSYLDNKINIVNEKVELIKLQNGLK